MRLRSACSGFGDATVTFGLCHGRTTYGFSAVRCGTIVCLKGCGGICWRVPDGPVGRGVTFGAALFPREVWDCFEHGRLPGPELEPASRNDSVFSGPAGSPEVSDCPNSSDRWRSWGPWRPGGVGIALGIPSAAEGVAGSCPSQDSVLAGAAQDDRRWCCPPVVVTASPCGGSRYPSARMQ